MRTVWILGAGFSKPLGGPLLEDLLKPEAISDASSHYVDLSDRFLGPAAKTAVDLCNYGMKWSRGRPAESRVFALPDGEKLWPDAEGFIDFVDRAARDEDSSGAKRLRSLLGRSTAHGKTPNLKEIAAAARRLVAAQCASFTEYATKGQEQWKPYQNWALQLGQNHTVVNFNYDKVVETVLGWRPEADESAETPLPNEHLSADGAFRHLKLHGSVTWRWDGKVFFREPDAFLKGGDQELAMATPGPSKQEDSGRFETLWKHAETEIARANLVVFIGYRFPPTDSNALQRLTRALAGNNETALEIFTVLGPDLEAAESRRLRALLRFAVGGRGLVRDAGHVSLLNAQQESGKMYRTVEAFPLYSQDFFSLVPGTQPDGWRRNL